MRIIIHRGTSQIGGTCIEVTTGNTRIILDVGQNLKPHSSDQGLKVDGLFACAKGDIQGIFLSHAHLDHSGLLPECSPHVPVYLSRETDKILTALSIFSRSKLLGRRKRFILEPFVSHTVGDLSITAIPVDHSVLGSVGFLIESGKSKAFYTGDLRFHGRSCSLEKFANLRSLKNLDALIMEGTNFREITASGLSEQKLEEKLANIIQNSKGLVLAFFSPTHADRLKSFIRAAGQAGRQFLPDTYTAYLMHLFPQQSFNLPNSRGRQHIFFNKGSSNAIKRSKLCAGFQRLAIPIDELIAGATQYVLPCRESTIRLDFGGELPADSAIIYSMWSGYLREEKGLQLQSLARRSNAAFHAIHASGHIYPEDIKEFVTRLAPKRLIPIHTDHPESFSFYSDVLFPKDGDPINLNKL